MTDIADVRAASDPRRIQSGQEFADALTGLRHRAGRSIRQVARITAIPSATLGGYFSGRHLPPATQPHLLDEILAALGERDPDLVAQWHAALLRVRRGPARGVRASGPGRALPSGISPYRGLEPFGVPDAGIFYRREGIVEELVSTVHERAGAPDRARLILLVGPPRTPASTRCTSRAAAPRCWPGAVPAPSSPGRRTRQPSRRVSARPPARRSPRSNGSGWHRAHRSPSHARRRPMPEPRTHRSRAVYGLVREPVRESNSCSAAGQDHGWEPIVEGRFRRRRDRLRQPAPSGGRRGAAGRCAR